MFRISWQKYLADVRDISAPETMFQRTDLLRASKAAESILKDALDKYGIKFEELIKSLSAPKTEYKAVETILRSVARRFKVDYEGLIKTLSERI